MLLININGRKFTFSLTHLSHPPTLQAAEKTWVENEPERHPFHSQYVGSSQKEEKTQVVFITLTTIFVVIVIGCIIEVYRTNRAHKKRLERETDESIIWSKEQATKLMEVGAAAAGGKALLGYKPVRSKRGLYTSCKHESRGQTNMGCAKNIHPSRHAHRVQTHRTAAARNIIRRNVERAGILCRAYGSVFVCVLCPRRRG